jgi:hypothetical protein
MTGTMCRLAYRRMTDKKHVILDREQVDLTDCFYSRRHILLVFKIERVVTMAESGTYLKHNNVSWDAIAAELTARKPDDADSNTWEFAGSDCRAAYRKAKASTYRRGPWEEEEVSTLSMPYFYNLRVADLTAAVNPSA